MKERIEVLGWTFAEDLDGSEQFYIHGNRENCTEQILVHFPATVAREMAKFIDEEYINPKPTNKKKGAK